MKKLLLIGLLSFVGVNAEVPLAHCVWCSRIDCYGHCAGDQCQCMRERTPGPGTCVSLQAVPVFAAHGYTAWK